MRGFPSPTPGRRRSKKVRSEINGVYSSRVDSYSLGGGYLTSCFTFVLSLLLH